MLRATALTLALTLLAVAPAMAAPGDGDYKYSDPIISMHAEQTYDAAYLWHAIWTLATELQTIAGEGQDGDDLSKAMNHMASFGFDHLQTYTQITTINDDGWYQSFKLQFDDQIEGTPAGRWMSMEPSGSPIPSRLADEDFLIFMSISNPDLYLELVDEKMFMPSEAAELMGPEMAGMAEGIPMLLDMARELLGGSTAMHLVLYDVDINAFKPSGAVIIEYEDGTSAFTETLAGLSAAGAPGDDVMEIQGVDDIPVQPSWSVEGNVAVLATDPATVLSTFDWATKRGSSSDHTHDSIYETRINAQRFRELVPSWVKDMAMSEVAGGSGLDIDVESLKQIKLGVLEVRRVEDENALTIEMTADRGLVHAAYKLYEQFAFAAIVKEAQKAAEAKKETDAITGVETIDSALSSYHAMNERYPEDLKELLAADHLMTWPTNPFTGEEVQLVSFENRSPGNITYLRYTNPDGVASYQILVYGAADGYHDLITNEPNADGSYSEFTDGYEDMVIKVLPSGDTYEEEWDEELMEDMAEEADEMDAEMSEDIEDYYDSDDSTDEAETSDEEAPAPF